jgi:hypothetical protein
MIKTRRHSRQAQRLDAGRVNRVLQTYAGSREARGGEAPSIILDLAELTRRQPMNLPSEVFTSGWGTFKWLINIPSFPHLGSWLASVLAVQHTRDLRDTLLQQLPTLPAEVPAGRTGTTVHYGSSKLCSSDL